ncbi:RagB/SusD family nutrient uptake outer membrane protein, partial [Acinetobacter baumannii]
PTTANNVNMWANLYGLINRCNIAIDGFAKASGGVLTAPVASQYIAECRFLRAMAHHEALIHFARPYTDNAGKNVGVPYRDFPVNSGT